MVIDRHEETSRWRQESSTMLGMRHPQCHAHRVTIHDWPAHPRWHGI
jgi:hypothetical protein